MSGFTGPDTSVRVIAPAGQQASLSIGDATLGGAIAVEAGSNAQAFAGNVLAGNFDVEVGKKNGLPAAGVVVMCGNVTGDVTIILYNCTAPTISTGAVGGDLITANCP